MNPYDFIARVKQNLIISFDDDDELIESFITAAINYAESYQHHEEGYYKDLSPNPFLLSQYSSYPKNP